MIGSIFYDEKCARYRGKCRVANTTIFRVRMHVYSRVCKIWHGCRYEGIRAARWVMGYVCNCPSSYVRSYIGRRRKYNRGLWRSKKKDCVFPRAFHELLPDLSRLVGRFSQPRGAISGRVIGGIRNLTGRAWVTWSLNLTGRVDWSP